MGKAYRFGQTVFGQAARPIGSDVEMEHPCPGLRDRRGTVARFPPLEERDVVIIFGVVRNQSSPSYRLIGAPGMMVEIACL